MRRTEITQSIKDALKDVPYKMETWLYGSEARGDARPDSDIDLLILVDQPTLTGKDEDAIFAPLYELELNSGVLINPLIIPKSQWGAHISPFYINVENEGIRLWIDYDDFFNHTLENVDELIPDAKLFIQAIKDLTDKWLKEQE